MSYFDSHGEDLVMAVIDRSMVYGEKTMSTTFSLHANEQNSHVQSKSQGNCADAEEREEEGKTSDFGRSRRSLGGKCRLRRILQCVGLSLLELVGGGVCT